MIKYILVVFILFMGLNSFAISQSYSIRTVGPVTIIESEINGYKTKQISLDGWFIEDDEGGDKYIEQKQREFIKRRDNWIRQQERIRHQQELEFKIGLIRALVLGLIIFALSTVIYFIYKGAQKVYQKF